MNVPKIQTSTTSPVRPRARRLAPAARRAQLLDCAIRVFAREGISHSNHTLIAAEAGVSLPAVFAYFPTHESLTHEVLAHVSTFMLDRLILPTQTGKRSGLLEIQDTLTGFSDLIDSHRDIARVWLDWSTAVRDATWPLYQDHHKKVATVFEQTLDRAKAAGELPDHVDCADAAWVLIGLGHMIAQMKFAHLPRDRIIKVVHSVVQNYFPVRQGAGSPESVTSPKTGLPKR